MSFRARAEANDTELLSTRQAERLSAIVGQAQPPKSARLRAEARTHFKKTEVPHHERKQNCARIGSAHTRAV
jgi:hypothetical protein